MSLATGYKLIENRDTSLPLIKEIAKTHARAIMDIVYEAHPDLDQKAGVFWNCGVYHKQDCIIVEFLSEYGVFTFYCKNDGSVHCIVWMRTRPNSEWSETLETFSEAIIVRHINRKRLPSKKKRAT